MKSTHLINLVLLVILFGGSVWAWPQLPQSIPVHVDARGDVTWSPTTLLGWFGLPLVALALTAMNYWFAHMLPRWPKLINIPDKQKFLALPAARQAPVIDRIREMLYGLSAPLIGIMGLIQAMMYRIALGESTEGYMLMVILLTVLMTPLILGLWLPKVQKELDRQLRATASDG